MAFKSFEELDAWQHCRSVRVRISQLTKGWPASEKFNLIDQILRSSRSPCANVAEGFGRFYEKENIRFCRIALGSLQETKNHIGNALEEGFVTEAECGEVMALCRTAIETTLGYIRYLERLTRQSSVSEPSSSYGTDETAS